MQLPAFDVKAVNASAYGASWVLLNKQGRPAAPLYNYLKPFPPSLQRQFYDRYGGETALARATASPVLGSLNSGLQLYRIKYQRPELFRNLGYALHLPQYVSYLLTGRYYSDITSIGCHTGLWNFGSNHYHEWVQREGISAILPHIFPSHQTMNIQWNGMPLKAGVGLHDSSAALIPYLMADRQPFVLLSTGTWCISLNPFNDSPLTVAELQQDCLQYLQYNGKPVKASRLFAGDEHERQTRRIAAHFQLSDDFYHTLPVDMNLTLPPLAASEAAKEPGANALTGPSSFARRDLSSFPNAASAYGQLIADIVAQQFSSTSLVLHGGAVKRIYVDGGFARNPFYMMLLTRAFPQMQVLAATVSQATALGTALAIHPGWNNHPIPGNLVQFSKPPGTG